MRHRYRRRTVFLRAGITVAWSLIASGASAQLPEFALENPAPGVYVHYGQQAEMSRANFGDIANLGFVVGTRCVAVIDTGGTYAVGRALRQAIRRVTAVPVCYVINTHGHPDHVFGNSAFAEDRPEFIGHARLADALQRRGPNYLNALRRDLGDAADRSGFVLPTRSIASTDELDLGGRTLSLRAWKTAHTDTDLTVFDPLSQTLWLGDLLFVGHVPVVDGNLRGFLAAIDELKTLRASLAIPGHGRALAWPDAIAPQERYLRRLLGDVRAAIKAKRTLADTLALVGSAREHWFLYDQFHRRNVTAAYAELEWDD
ncbi:MAG: quinoprotein relay system zinc metallohydrolase 2 [Betaproteobacteria bacterium]|nr:quinoprotein relay system zinc metallohydrolase 2 [Betaproteobacteria bacterium]